MTYDRGELLRHREPVQRRGFGGQLACEFRILSSYFW